MSSSTHRAASLLRHLLALPVAAALVAACGSDTTHSGKACTEDKDCPTGYVCDDQVCGQVSCVGNGDCLNGDQACITVGSGDFCSAVECGCANCATCPLGEVCDNGTCAAPTTCGPTSPCSGTDICDAGACRPCAGAECPADCTVTGCTGGKTCNPTTKLCEGGTPTAEICDTCAAQDACPDDWTCVPLATGQHCLPPCASANDCPTGFDCQNTICAPAGGRCEGCFLSGCGAGLACNANTAVCGQAVAECGTCTADWECGAGFACKSGECRERCDGTTCPGGGACTTTTSGVQVCQDGCAAQCTPACSGATPICDGTRCVQCRNAGDCDNGQTCDASGLCVGGPTCTAPTPVLWNGTCVECTSNADCGARFCDISTHTCSDSQCASCNDPYPACVTIGSDSYCVQCAVDEDCGPPPAECNPSTYACEGGNVTPTEFCETDEDCDSGTSTGFVLECVPLAGQGGKGLCVDVNGACDDVTAFCVTASGAQTECSSLLDLFGGGALPPELGGGGTLPGNCGCGDCALDGLPGCFGAEDCRVGACWDFAALLVAIGGGTPGASAPICFEFQL